MSTWLDTIMSPLNTAGQGIEKLIETRDFIKFGEELRKLHSAILAAQRGAMTAQANEATLLEQVRELKKRVTDLEAWDAEKARYQLVALAPDVVAYAIKPHAAGVEPAHYICANCYQRGSKSHLQKAITGTHVDKYRCNECKEELTIPKGSRGPGATFGRTGSADFDPFRT
jgi:hypothetical protein